jgi:hypothetical protein
MTMGVVCRLYSRSLERKSSRTLAPIALTIRIPDLSIKVVNPAISLTSASATRKLVLPDTIRGMRTNE